MLYSSANVQMSFLSKTVVCMLMDLVMSCVLNVIAYMIYTHMYISGRDMLCTCTYVHVLTICTWWI